MSTQIKSLLSNIKRDHQCSLKNIIKSKEDSYFKKFFNTFKELYINLSLLDVLYGMPKYAKYLKDVVINKIKFHNIDIVELIEE